VNGIFMSNPFVFGFECSGTECAEKWQILLRLSSAVDTIDGLSR